MDEHQALASVDTDVVVAALAANAARWLGGREPGDCVVRIERHRAQSTLIWARLTAGQMSADVVAKVPRATAIDGVGGRLFAPVDDPLLKAEYEQRTLATVCQGLAGVDDGKWGVAEPVGYLPELGVVVTRELTSPTFDRLLRGHAGPLLVPPAQVMSNLGSWLGMFQGLRTEHMEPRDTTPDQLVGGVIGLVEAVRVAGRGSRLPPELDALVERFRAELASSGLSTGLGHGDLAPRNVFVDEAGRVTVIDSLGRFTVPVHEDLAYLLVELTVGASRYVRRGLPRMPGDVAELRAALLAGHGAEDDAVLWFFELRVLLDKLRALVQRRPTNRSSSLVASARELLVVRRLNQVARRLGAAW